MLFPIYSSSFFVSSVLVTQRRTRLVYRLGTESSKKLMVRVLNGESEEVCVQFTTNFHNLWLMEVSIDVNAKQPRDSCVLKPHRRRGLFKILPSFLICPFLLSMVLCYSYFFPCKPISCCARSRESIWFLTLNDPICNINKAICSTNEAIYSEKLPFLRVILYNYYTNYFLLPFKVVLNKYFLSFGRRVFQ